MKSGQKFGPPPKKKEYWWPKTSKFRRDVGQIRDLIANISGLELSVQLVSKVSNFCDPDPPTDRRTDGMQSHYRALHYSASRDKNQ